MTANVAVDLGGTSPARGQDPRQHCVETRLAHRARDRSCRSGDAGIDRRDRDRDERRGGGDRIGVPIVVDCEHGIVYVVQNIPSWKEVHLKEQLESEFHLPVHVNNDANCFALGECHFGKARGYRHIVGLTLGTGLGAGSSSTAKLYNGSNCGRRAKFGTIPYKDPDR